ncbi:MAG: bifunctional phosphoribosyl-AMP cyclohydrolase/phosphoribosyl-ATP diphosphatase HisIE [Candidatus Limnocylindrales bacterium]|jgi:phosphoribosyl-ATP pyrophosphohydrolase/phosphoribosyl-AMP cyclohydrolase
MIGRQVSEENVAWGPSGLVPAVVQDAVDGRVLMVAYVDAEALAATLATGEVHFHSRSRARLWRKGETSGNVLRLLDVELDCDGDALLFQVDPTGPTCHRNTRSCFDAARAKATPAMGQEAVAAAQPPAAPGAAAPLAEQGFAWLETLWATIDSRADADPAASYTARLLAAGVDGPSRKVAEEATEVLMAAKDDAVAAGESRPATRDALAGEVADLLYHTLVLLRERGLPPGAVIARLRERHKA